MFLNERMATESKECGYGYCTGMKTLTPTLSTELIVIKILYWNSK